MIDRRTFIKSGTLSAAGIFLVNPMRHGLPDAYVVDDYAMRFRQIHLDFHSSELIEDLVTQFDPTEFATTLKKASVNSVTCFGRCHHGYIYYDTPKFPERHHPHLKRNLLKEQIEACHKENIRVPIYTTVQWDKYSAVHHPEWLMRDDQGRPIGTPSPFEAGFYEHLCILTPYRDFLKNHLTELFEQVPVDGLFFDIHHVYPNANRATINAMIKKGLKADIAEERFNFYTLAIQEFKSDIKSYVAQLDKNAKVFFNGGHVGPKIRPELPSYDHLELESLPSGGWGYLHFPLTSRYARNLNKEIMGMTGKFHTAWGDFHSLKNKAALEFECNMMLALNAKCSIGDQLAPRGKLDKATYDLIGSVYSQVANKESWCTGARALTDIAVYSGEEFEPNKMIARRTPDEMMGAIRMLQEGKHQFDVIDSLSEIQSYKVLILPDVIVLDNPLQQKLKNYIAQGGKIIASFQSGLTPDKKDFALDHFGISLVGEAPFSPDFIDLKGGAIGRGLPETELVMYLKGMQVKTNHAQILAQTNMPYFNRTWEHFHSHRHTPSSGKVGYPAITQSEGIIYFMHPIFTQYAKNAPQWCRALFLNALDILLPEPLVKTPDAPSALIATLNDQTLQKRKIIHLLYYVPERRGVDFDVIEDIIPLFNTKVSIKSITRPTRLMTVPENKSIPFVYMNGRIDFVLPELRGHQMIEIK